MLEGYQRPGLEVNQDSKRDRKKLEKYHPRVGYSYARIVQRIQDAVARSGLNLKKIQEETKISKDQWSRKMKPAAANPDEKGTKASFTFAEYNRLREYFKAPEGWPFVDWSLADQAQGTKALAERLEALERVVSAPPPRKAPESPGRPRGRKTGAGSS